MRSDTRIRILNAAIDLFSENGYAATNIQSIADAVGIVKSALYRHFESKEEIWNAVFESTNRYYEERFGTVEHLPLLPESTEELFEMTMRMVNFTIHDEMIVKMRKIILTEQFRDERVSCLATRYFVEDTKDIFEKVFSFMMDSGTLKRADAGFLAFSYTAPITQLIHLCDREPAKTEETLEKICDFITSFVRMYGSDPAGGPGRKTVPAGL